MAKGRTSQPILIVVADEWMEHAAVKELINAGHRVFAWSWVPTLPGGSVPDLILHPAAGWHEALFEAVTTESGAKRRPYLEARVRWARAQRRGKK